MGSPSELAVLNSTSAGSDWPTCRMRFALVGVATGKLLPVVMLQLTHAPKPPASLACTHTVSLPGVLPATHCTFARSAARTLMLVFAFWLVTPIVKWPLPAPAPPSQKLYCVMASPSASLALNSAAALTDWPACNIRFALAGVATGRVLPVVMVQFTHAPNPLSPPSLACTQTVSLPGALPAIH